MNKLKSAEAGYWDTIEQLKPFAPSFKSLYTGPPIPVDEDAGELDPQHYLRGQIQAIIEILRWTGKQNTRGGT